MDTEHELAQLDELRGEEAAAVRGMQEQIRAVKQQIEAQPVSKAELTSMVTERCAAIRFACASSDSVRQLEAAQAARTMHTLR